MALSHAAQLRLAELRAKQNSGQELTREELTEAVTLMRNGRVAAAATSATSRGKKASAAQAKLPIDSDDLLNQLGGL